LTYPLLQQALNFRKALVISFADEPVYLGELTLHPPGSFELTDDLIALQPVSTWPSARLLSASSESPNSAAESGPQHWHRQGSTASRAPLGGIIVFRLYAVLKQQAQAPWYSALSVRYLSREPDLPQDRSCLIRVPAFGQAALPVLFAHGNRARIIMIRGALAPSRST